MNTKNELLFCELNAITGEVTSWEGGGGIAVSLGI